MKKSKTKKIRKIPLLAAILNIVLSGAGYLYVGKRKLFGILLIIFEALSWLWAYYEPIVKEIAYHPLGLISTLIFLLAIAIDAYQDAVEVNKNKN